MISPRLGSALVVAAAVTLSARGAAAAPTVDLAFDGPPGPLHLELPLLDAPANMAGHYTFPSMAQSKWITVDLYELAHFAAGRLLGRKTWYGLLVTSAFDAATIFVSVPFFGGWQHEEWHRAMLMRRGIASENPYYGPPSMPFFDPKTIALSNEVTAALKREHPVDYVRALAAGFEGQYALAAELEKQAFFRDQPTVSGFIVGMTYLMTSFYMAGCASRPTGQGDCNLWTDGLVSPKTPPIPEGQAASSEQQRYLKRQMALSFLNFADPFVFMVRDLRFGDTRVNAAVRHVPTSFGDDIRVDFYYRDPKRALLLSLHNYANAVRWFPGIEAELVRLPAGPVRFGARSALWLQPSDQGFHTKTPRPGADLAVRVDVPLARGRVEPWVEVEGKTAGWVTGNAYNEASLAARVGIGVNLF